MKKIVGIIAMNFMVFSALLVGVEILVVHPVNTVFFNVAIAFHSKAQCVGNGHSLFKHCNAAVGCYGYARRVSLSVPLTALRLLERERPFPARRALSGTLTD